MHGQSDRRTEAPLITELTVRPSDRPSVRPSGWLTGIDPATSGATVQRSNRLSYSHHAEQNLTSQASGQKRRASSAVRGSAGTETPSGGAGGPRPRTPLLHNTVFPASPRRREPPRPPPPSSSRT